jgi:lysophospholipase L1-like esterase
LTIDTGENAENVQITAISGSTVTVTRNVGGLNASHAAGAPVTETDTLHLNRKGAQVVANAVAAFLSPYATQEE